jgi:hypothetical protein
MYTREKKVLNNKKFKNISYEYAYRNNKNLNQAYQNITNTNRMHSGHTQFESQPQKYHAYELPSKS